MKLSTEEKLEKIKALRPIDDIFFEAIAQEEGVCEELLRVIMEDPELTVLEVIPQDTIRNLYGRSVRLDALCRLADNTLCNIEVQRANNSNHLKRVRFNAASIDTRESFPGETFENLRDLYIIYISEFDFLGKGETVYRIEKTIRKTGEFIDDGLHVIFVNTKNNDGSAIAELMACFLQTNVENEKFPKLTKAVKAIKSKEGVTSMSETMERLFGEYFQEARRQGLQEGREEGRVKGLEEGREEGRVKGLEEGREEGREEERARILKILHISEEEFAAKLAQSNLSDNSPAANL